MWTYDNNMCRLFYALNQTGLKKKIMDFLHQIDHIDKHTPGLKSSSDHITHTDGFGFAWFNPIIHKWSAVKSPLLYRNVPNLQNLVNRMSVSSLLVGHLRKQSGETAFPKKENTHPFTYKNQLFIQNGQLDNVEEKRGVLLKHISRQYLNQIQGDTDTELIFYLFLSMKDKLEESNVVKFDKQGYSLHTPIQSELKLIVDALTQLFTFLQRYFHYFNANLIYANKWCSVITRYRYVAKNKSIPEAELLKKAPSLYINTAQSSIHKLFISSEPLSDNVKLIPENTAICVNHINNEYQFLHPW